MFLWVRCVIASQVVPELAIIPIATTPLPPRPGSNKPAPCGMGPCLSAAHSSSRSSAGGGCGKLSDSHNSCVLGNGLRIDWYGDPEASMCRVSGHTLLQKKVDSGGSVSLGTESSRTSHTHERSSDHQGGCQPVQLSRRPSPHGSLVQEITDSSCYNPTTKGKYEWVECSSPQRKGEGSQNALKVESVRHQLKLLAHSEAVAKHLLKKLILTRDHRDPVHLS